MQKYVKPLVLGGAAVFAHSQVKEMSYVKGLSNELLRTVVPYAAAAVAVVLVEKFI